ncbi:MAG: hypothetical protein AB7N71_11420 [Phycisphaerae bacterium]
MIAPNPHIRRRFWKVARIAALCAALAFLLADQADRAGRLALWSIAEMDYVATAQTLRSEARFEEAIGMLQAGIAGADNADARAPMIAELEKTISAQHSVLRRAGEVAKGALTGHGKTPEALAGAIGTDLFVVGDVRDLAIQSANWARSQDVDAFIVALSTVGIATTALPQLDGALGTLKAAAKSGAIRPAFARQAAKLLRVQSGKAALKNARHLLTDVSKLRKATSTGTMIRLLRHADDPKDLARMSKYIQESRHGAFALLATGDDGVAALRAGGSQIQWIEQAARRGAEGRRWLRSAARIGLRPHPLLGIAKGLYKGNVPRFVPNLLKAIDRACWWFVPALATWLFLELMTIARFGRTSARKKAEELPGLSRASALA